MAHLVLIRHGRSEYNVKGLWTGWHDPELTRDGREEVKKAAQTIADIPLSLGFSSPQIRHQDTLAIVKRALQIEDLPIIIDDALKERNYGDYTGKNKWEVKKILGEEEFFKLRRGWDYPVPNGESLKQVYDRVVRYYTSNIFPNLLQQKNVIISSSGNALRSLVKFLENITEEDIVKLEIAPGEVYVYTLDERGNITHKEIRNAGPNTV